MTDHCSPTRDPGQTPREGLHDRSWQEVLAAVQRIVRDTGGRFVTRPLVSGEPDGPTTRDAEPLAGAGEAHRVELGLPIGPDRGPLQTAVHVLGERVALLHPVDAQVQHAAVDVRAEVPAPALGSLEVGLAHLTP